jgi:hypothetical protein
LAQLVERERLLEQVLRDATANRVHLSKHPFRQRWSSAPADCSSTIRATAGKHGNSDLLCVGSRGVPDCSTRHMETG